MEATTYWLPFVSFTVLSFAPRSQHNFWKWAAAFLLIGAIGSRYEIGADWSNYLRILAEIRELGLTFALQRTDTAYGFLNWLGAQGIGGIYFVNTVCAVLAVIPLVAFCATRKNPALALLVATPYIITVVFMGYTRQGVAVGLGMGAMLAVERRRIGWFLAAVTLAALFHKGAVCLFVLTPALFAGELDRRNMVKLIGIFAYAAALSTFLFWQELFPLAREYVVATGDALTPMGSEVPGGFRSDGAVLRLSQSVVAVAAFIIIARRTRLPPAQLWLWSIVSACIMLLFVLAFFRSTLADRTALFFMPLQVYAFATLPGIFRRPVSLLVQCAIIVCFAASFWVWQTRGSDSRNWIPYRSVITQWVGLEGSPTSSR